MNCTVRFGKCFLRVPLTDTPDLLPCAMLPRQARGNLKKTCLQNLRYSSFCHCLIGSWLITKTYRLDDKTIPARVGRGEDVPERLSHEGDLVAELDVGAQEEEARPVGRVRQLLRALHRRHRLRQRLTRPRT